MLAKTFYALLGLTLGSIVAYFVYNTNPFIIQETFTNKSVKNQTVSKIGFLPFWLINEADKDYSKYLNEITYFNLTVGEDGHIKKLVNPRELDPGWNTLSKNRFSSQGLKNSVAIFSGNDEVIDKLIDNPSQSAQNLVSDLVPLLNQYNFTKINIDIEKVSDATYEERKRFTEFVKVVRNLLDPKIQISIDVTASSFVKETNLVNNIEIEPYVDQIIVMAYDFHHPSSMVTGPVAPLNGAGVISEYDVETTIKTALVNIPKQKIILGIPLYGYSWETLNEATRSATIPVSYITVSSKKAENLNGIYDETDQEMYSVNFDSQTGAYRQTFYPNEKSTKAKLDIAKKYKLGGVAFWALGYEDETILRPLLDFDY